MGEGVTTDNLETRALPCPCKFSTGSPLATPDLDFDFAPSVEGEHSQNTANTCYLVPPFSILYYSARSLLPKMDELRLVQYVSLNNLMLFALLKPGLMKIYWIQKFQLKITELFGQTETDMVVALLCTSGIVCIVMYMYVTWIHGVWS